MVHTRRCKTITRALFAVSLLVPLLAGCNRKKELLPAALVGTWVTDAPAYAGRSFTFQAPNTLIIQAGENSHASNSRKIRAVRGKFDADKKATLYRIEYREAGENLYFPLYLFTEPSRMVRFKNQPDITWKPAEEEQISRR
jgi:hypothetical protein